ncbi:hypothetical protein KY360_02795 [Candidatus Woesearchaeota archaeon]|nr:hypothetical protein [Candidatus Woesearchaeota archaeon]
MKKIILFCLVLLVVLAGCRPKEKIVIADKTGAMTKSMGGPSLNCQDSDGGNTPEVKGTVTVTGAEETDSCLGDFLVEYYCENGRKTHTNIRCDCEDGACS